ncbi:MAG: hypothetical protein V1660_01375 [archaeon]
MASNKKAQGLSINTVILLILAIIVLIVIISGFSMGWGSMWGRVQGFFSKTNVDVIANTCSIQCTTNQAYEFCNSQKTLKIERINLGLIVAEKCTGDGEILSCIATCDYFKGKITGLDNCDICKK